MLEHLVDIIENLPDIEIGLLFLACTFFLVGTIFGSIFFRRALNLSWINSLVCIVLIILYSSMVAILISFFIVHKFEQPLIPLIADINSLNSLIQSNEKDSLKSLMSLANNMEVLNDRINLISKDQLEFSKHILPDPYDDSNKRIQSLLLTNLSDINPYKID